MGNKMMALSNKGKRVSFVALDTFGKRLKILRVDRSLSQIELRDQMEQLHQVKIGETYISELERTQKMPMLEVAAAMARVLDVSLDYLGLLHDDASISYRHPAPVDRYITPEADEAAQLVDSMRPEYRAVLLTLARSLARVPTARQREETEAREILDSIERQFGKDVRVQVEKMLRNKGFPVNSAS